MSALSDAYERLQETSAWLRAIGSVEAANDLDSKGGAFMSDMRCLGVECD